MDYNTQRKKLVLPEYGRTIQLMVDYCLSLEDREERTKAAHTVIAIMGNMNPHLRDVADFKHKLWDHLAIMSDFGLDIDWPYPLPDLSILNEKPEKLPYSENKFRFVHYGKFTEQIINKINDIEDADERQALIETMANHMKRSYMVWKKEPIPDEIIFKELVMLTRGEVEVPENLKLGDFKDALVTTPPINQKPSKRRIPQKRKK
ncbi:MAG: DUF4290 domain-containing protein [Bacteroidales bacterium]|jgi:hypothetical protein|nr:DUF4290 domain-containing protein [Bacteroidales bacterium]